MSTTFLNDFSDNTKVWVYQSPRPFSVQELAWINEEAARFTSGWNAHGAKMKSSIQVLHDRFLVIASDQDFAANSGCSIDSMVGFVRAVQTNTGLNLMDRMLVYYEKDGEVHPFHFQETGKLVQEGVLTEDTIVFNPLVDSKPTFEKTWRAPLKSSWLARFAS
ncbi:MAG: hypothetical protein V4616_00775 [Bacteroidota bacterium]